MGDPGGILKGRFASSTFSQESIELKSDPLRPPISEFLKFFGATIKVTFCKPRALYARILIYLSVTKCIIHFTENVKKEQNLGYLFFAKISSNPNSPTE